MSAWSKLQKALYNVVTDKVDFQIHCSVYRMASERGSINLPRYWITIGGVIIFDYPKQFIDKACTKDYPYDTQISDISNCIREYVDCPIDLLPNKIFDNDKWDITDIFKAVDRRLGRERLKVYFSSPNPTIKIILDKRFGDKGE